MAADAGTVYASVRVQLDTLQGDINAVKMMFADMSAKLDKQAEKQKEAAKGLKANLTALSTGYLAITSAANTVINIFKKVNDFIHNATMKYATHQQELAKLNSILKTTGAEAWTTAGQLDKMADSLSRTTQFAQNDIMKAQAVLLGFYNITGDVYERTLNALIDNTAVMGGDLVSAASTFGKAIDDPVQGMSALNRQGYAFTRQDKEMAKQLVESGQIMEARALILDEVEKSMGGAAKAISSSSTALELYNERIKEYERLQEQAGRQTQSASASISRALITSRKAVADRLEIIADAHEALENLESLNTKQIDTISKLEKAQNDYNNSVAEGADDIEDCAEVLRNLQRELAETDVALAEANLAVELGKIQETWNNSRFEGQGQGVRKSLADFIKDYEDALTPYRQSLKEAEDALKDIQNINSAITQSRQNETNLLEVVNDKIDEIKEAAKKRIAIEKEVQQLYDKGAISADDYYSRIMSARQSEVALINSINAGVSELTTTEAGRKQLLEFSNNALEKAIDLQLTWNEAAKNREITEREFLEQRNKIETAYQEKLQHLQNVRDALNMSDLEYNKELLTIEQQRIQSLTELIETAKRTSENDPITFEMLSQSAVDTNKQEKQVELLKNEEDYKKKIAELDISRNRIGKEQWEIQRDILEIKKAETLVMVEQGKLAADIAQNYINALESLDTAQIQNDLVKAIEEYQNKIKMFGASNIQVLKAQREEALKAAEQFKNMPGYEKLIKDIQKYYELLEQEQAWKTFVSNAQKATAQVIELFSAISTAVLAFQKRDLDAYVLDLDKRNKKLQEALDEELAQKLYAAGFGQANNKENYEQDLQNAIATGNHRFVYEKQQALERYKIEKDIADKKKKLEDDIANAKAKAEYEYAINQWKVQLAMGYASVAQAIITAAASAALPWNLPAIGFATGIGAAQIAAIHAAKPPAPGFESGGIVPGNKFHGDQIWTRQNSGEMDLNGRQQKNLFNAIDSGELGNNRPIIIQTVIELDGEPIAEKVFELGSLGNHFIKARGVVR